MSETIIAVMAKKPQVGRTKTRLCPPLSLAQAARLYEALMMDSLALVNRLEGVDLAVAISPPESHAYFKAVALNRASLLPVEGKDIGVCLATTLAQLLGMGYRKALVLNSDGPSLPPGYILQAIEQLDEHDLVLGPSDDGGYYLVGMKQLHLGIFAGITWSTEKVLSQTMQRAEEAGLRVALSMPWYDIDTPLDLKRLLVELSQLSPQQLVNTRACLADLTYPPKGHDIQHSTVTQRG